MEHMPPVIPSDLSTVALAKVEVEGSPAGFLRQGFQFHVISGVEDPLFELAYQKLWDEFGYKNEMEERSLIENRFHWTPEKTKDGYVFKYEMLLVLKDSQFVATRDHTVIVKLTDTPEVFVHLSHVLIDPEFRGKGLALILQDWPLQIAGKTLHTLNLHPKTPITLIAEMEVHNKYEPDPSVLRRLKAYKKGSFQKINPHAFQYFQPDFRPKDEIEKTGLKPLHLHLLIKRFHPKPEFTGQDLHHIIESLYTMYGKSFSPMDFFWKHLSFAQLTSKTHISLQDPMQY